jgi:hypothetical protein
VNERKSSLEAETVRSIGALGSLQSNKKFAIQKEACNWEITIKALLKQWTEIQWILDYVERETTGATKRVEDAESAVQQMQEDMKEAQNTSLKNWELAMTFQEMMVAIGDRLSHLARSDKGEDEEDVDDDETAQSQLSKDDQPG